MTMIIRRSGDFALNDFLTGGGSSPTSKPPSGPSSTGPKRVDMSNFQANLTSFGGSTGGGGGTGLNATDTPVTTGGGPGAVQVAQSNQLTQQQIQQMLNSSGWVVVANMPANSTITIDGDETTSLDGRFGRAIGWLGGDQTTGSYAISVDSGVHTIAITDVDGSVTHAASATIAPSGAGGSVPEWDPSNTATVPTGIVVSNLDWATMPVAATGGTNNEITNNDPAKSGSGVSPALIVAGVVVVGAVAFFALRPRANPRRRSRR